MTIRFGSVCSGIEAASVAFAPLGWECAWLAEVDIPASAVLAHRLGATRPVFPLDPDEPGLDEKSRRERRNAIKAAEKITWRNRITNWGDMTKLPDAVLDGLADAPDVLCGGTPCQGFSIAGLRGGLGDPRGQLTLSFVELANAIDDVREERDEPPCVVLWENVPGVLTDKGNAFGHFLAGLAGEDLPLEPPGGKWTNAGLVVGPQRTVAWIVKDAQYFRLAQRRARVFVVASAMEGFDPGLVLFEFDGLRRDSAPSRKAREDFAATLTASLGGCSGKDGIEGRVVPHVTNPYLRVIADAGISDDPRILTPRGYRLVSFGEYRDDEVASTMLSRDHKYVTDIVVDAYGFQPRIGRNGRGAMGDLVSALTAQAGETGKGDAAPCVAVLPFDTTQLTDPRNGSNPQWGDACHPLTRGGHAPAIAFSSKDYGADATEELAPTLRAMNHSGSHANAGGQIAVLYSAEVSPTLRAGGNKTGGDRPPGTDVDTADSNIVCVTGDVTHTLTAEGFDASEDGTGRGNPIVVHGTQDPCVGDIAFALGRNNGGENVIWQPEIAVRRLIPVECERLQGFPDGWTDVPIGNKGAADGPRYKQLGNSWAVNVVRWIGERLDAEITRAKSSLASYATRKREIEELI